MPPKKPVPAKAPVKPAAKAPVGRGTPAGRGAPAAKGGPAARGGAVKKGPTPAAGAKKPGAAAAPAKGGKAADSKPKERVWTEKDTMARRIQKAFRKYRAKKLLEKKKKEKEAYDELMDKLEKEAFVQLVKMEQEQAEKERKIEEEKRRKRREAKLRQKRMLEASFDGDTDAMEEILHEVADQDDKDGIGDDVIGRGLRAKHLLGVIECEDANENRPISEAASGGHVDTIKFLLAKGTNPNCVGQFMRTPLYRAAFAGHLEACQVLLQSGADPRPYASDGQTPEQVASVPAIVELLSTWDITETERLMEKLEAEKEKRRDLDRQRRDAEQEKLEKQVELAQEEYDIQQKRLDFQYKELNKRISEHDHAVAEGFDRPELTIQSIQDAEGDLEFIKMDMEKAREKLAMMKLKLREQKKGGEESMDEEDLPGVKASVRELDDVLLRDVGNRIKDSGKWPLIIDPHAQAATFLRYRDTNYINCLSPNQMAPEKVRLSVLGSVRFGKACVLDMMEVDMFHAVKMKFDEVQPGLLDSMMDKSIMEEEKYSQLIRETDPPDYQKNKFISVRTVNFKVFIITKNKYPPDELMDMTYPIRVIVPV